VELATPAQIRYAIRRIRRRIPEVSIVVALLGNAERFEDDETFADARNSCNNLYARLSIKSWLLP
jgi:hypothetical protein